MSHRKDLIKQGYKGGWHSTSKRTLQMNGKELKKMGKIRSYRVVTEGNGFEMYTR